MGAAAGSRAVLHDGYGRGWCGCAVQGAMASGRAFAAETRAATATLGLGMAAVTEVTAMGTGVVTLLRVVVRTPGRHIHRSIPGELRTVIARCGWHGQALCVL